MMAFTERGFIWIKTIENKKAKQPGNQKEDQFQSSQDSKLQSQNDNQEIKYEQVEKVFENIFLIKKESWSLQIEKFLVEKQNRSKDSNKIDNLKVIKENNDSNIIIEINSKQEINAKQDPNNKQEDGKQIVEKFQYLRTTQEFKDMLVFNKSIKSSPLGLQTIEGSTYEFGDYIIRIGRIARQKKVKIQIEYTPSKYEIGQNPNLEDYANKVIKPILQHLFQNLEEFKDIREGISEKELDSQEYKYQQLSKELQDIPHPFKSTRLFIKSYFIETNTK
ncbi:hypothetical protein ABPG72_019240 [Tetrahymena utriculariae]